MKGFLTLKDWNHRMFARSTHIYFFLLVPIFSRFCKVRTFWETHTFEKIFLMVLTNQLICLVNVKTMRNIFSNYVCFSKSPNFNWQVLCCNSQPLEKTILSIKVAVSVCVECSLLYVSMRKITPVRPYTRYCLGTKKRLWE